MNSLSKRKLSASEFKAEFELIASQQWLETKYDALEDTLALCRNAGERQMLINLMHRFTYLQGSEFKHKIQEIRDIIINKWELSPDNTFIVALHNDALADSAQLVVQALKGSFAELLGWEEKNFINSMPTAAHKIGGDTNLVLVDEFVGTGHQCKRILKKCAEYLDKKGTKNVNIFLSVVSGMSFSRSEISNLVESYEATLWLEKGLSGYLSGDELENAKDCMLRIEKELCVQYQKKNMPSFGQGQSETLYGYEMGNAPANVFPIFWWKWLVNQSPRRTLLSRI
ncbi:MAG: hypothetical protein COB93_00390 [Sneathiella sp.]|nr:MAG: hypothetical protein COB93_00390 [Sneathiella sp.]